MSETKKVATPKGIEIPADKLMSVVLERSLSDKDQTIGAQKEHVGTLRLRIEELEGELAEAKRDSELIADDQKMAVVQETNRKEMQCDSCGYVHKYSSSRTACRNCGARLPVDHGDVKVIEYRNMDTVIAEIRKEEAKSLKVDNVELESKLNTVEFELGKTVNELKKVENTQAQDLTDAKREVRERYQKEMKEIQKSLEQVTEDKDEKIDELVEEIQKLEENKTDVEVEEARKKEVIDLKEQIAELETVITEAKEASTPRMKKFWNKVADRKEKRKVEEEKEAKQDRVDQISNMYPKSAAPKEDQWWRKGKYDKTAKQAETGLKYSSDYEEECEACAVDSFYSNMAKKSPYGW